MALQKTIENPQTGQINDYWKIIETNIDWYRKTGRIVIGGFKNKEVRLEDKSPTQFFEMSINEDNMPTVDQNILVIGYDYFKTLSAFADAIDC